MLMCHHGQQLEAYTAKVTVSHQATGRAPSEHSMSRPCCIVGHMVRMSKHTVGMLHLDPEHTDHHPHSSVFCNWALPYIERSYWTQLSGHGTAVRSAICLYSRRSSWGTFTWRIIANSSGGGPIKILLASTEHSRPRDSAQAAWSTESQQPCEALWHPEISPLA